MTCLIFSERMVLQQELDVQQEQISLLERKCDDLNLAKSNLSQNISALKKANKQLFLPTENFEKGLTVPYACGVRSAY